MDGMDFEHNKYELPMEFTKSWDDMMDFLERHQMSSDKHLLTWYKESYFLGISKSTIPEGVRAYISNLLDRFGVEMPPLAKG